jgi:hypothetical protein
LEEVIPEVNQALQYLLIVHIYMQIIRCLGYMCTCLVP